MTLADDADAGGLLTEAFQAGELGPIHWTEVELDDLVVTVAADAVKAPIDGRMLRLPISYAEAIPILRALDCISPTYQMCLKLHAQARLRPQFHGLVHDAVSASKMKTVGFTRRFDAAIEAQLPADADPTALRFGPWKLWLLDAGIAVRGAVNHGFWDQTKVPPAPIQVRGTAHNAAHYDYSQVLQPVRRMARRKADGAAVDLLAWQGITGRVPAAYLLPYTLQAPVATAPAGLRQAPAAAAARVEAAPTSDLEQILLDAGLDVTAHPGWRTAGAADFAPQGIMLHHTAGGRVGDAPSLATCIHGRPDLSGPLCHLLLARSGKVHVIAARRANHAGRGASEVLQKVVLGEPVGGDARDHGYADSVSGGPSFYGIEVENDGVGEAYPEVQIRNLVLICAAICRANGWGAERIIHHRQWTQRKPDMSFRGDIWTLVAAELLL